MMWWTISRENETSQKGGKGTAEGMTNAELFQQASFLRPAVQWWASAIPGYYWPPRNEIMLWLYNPHYFTKLAWARSLCFSNSNYMFLICFSFLTFYKPRYCVNVNYLVISCQQTEATIALLDSATSWRHLLLESLKRQCLASYSTICLPNLGKVLDLLWSNEKDWEI